VRYKLAMFDFDGTLVDTLPWFFSAVNRMAEKHGFKKIEEGEVETLRGYSARQIVEHLNVPVWKLPKIGIDIRRLMAEDIRQIRPFEGIGAMLQSLSDKGVVLAVVTSNAYDNVRHVLGVEHAALISYYECREYPLRRRRVGLHACRGAEGLFTGRGVR
jgi:phosphoglycolate phosphatase